MLENPMDVQEQFPVRKTKKQKQAFRDAVQSYIRELGYESTVEKGSLGSRNVVIGDPKKAKYLVTAHYDTCVRLPVPNLITPCNFFTFLLYQLFVVAIMLLVPAVPGVLVGMLTDYYTGYLTWYGCFWVVFILMYAGPANKHNANDNTSGVVTVLEIMKALPADQREQVCFVLFDLEEAGLIGSASYKSAHKEEVKNQLVLNLDCVGDGDEIMFFPTKQLKKDARRMEQLKKCVLSVGEKSIAIREAGFSVYPSDQKHFPYGVGIAALHRNRWGVQYLSRIHTPRDTILEQTNVTILRDSLIGLIRGEME